MCVATFGVYVIYIHTYITCRCSPLGLGPTCFFKHEQAIKVFSKSLLLRRKNFQRGQQGRMAVTTDLDKVQREVAIMKKVGGARVWKRTH